MVPSVAGVGESEGLRVKGKRATRRAIRPSLAGCRVVPACRDVSRHRFLGYWRVAAWRLDTAPLARSHSATGGLFPFPF